MSTLPYAAQRAISFTMPYRRVYAACLTGKNWQVIHPDTGDVTQMPDRDFRAMFVLERDCPPGVRRMFDGMPAYASWRWGKS